MPPESPKVHFHFLGCLGKWLMNTWSPINMVNISTMFQFQEWLVSPLKQHRLFFSHSVGPFFFRKGSISKVGRCVSIAVKRQQLIECGPAGKQHLMKEENPGNHQTALKYSIQSSLIFFVVDSSEYEPFRFIFLFFLHFDFGCVWLKWQMLPYLAFSSYTVGIGCQSKSLLICIGFLP